MRTSLVAQYTVVTSTMMVHPWVPLEPSSVTSAWHADSTQTSELPHAGAQAPWSPLPVDDDEAWSPPVPLPLVEPALEDEPPLPIGSAVVLPQPAAETSRA